MDADQFFTSRQSEWQQLSNLLTAAERGIGRLSPTDIEALSRLYRAATSDLAICQRDYPRHRITAFLNQLVARGHAVLYRQEAWAWGRIWHFVTTGFPQTFRETSRFTLVATLLFVLPALLAGLAIYINPDMSLWLLPADAQQLRGMIEQQELWTDIPTAERPYASSFIMQNNIRVTFLAFGGGVLLGLLTVYAMVFNGLLIGGLTGLTAHYGVGFDLWTFVIGHGMIELTVIMIAGGSGLMLGWALIHPGLLKRGDALKLAARKAVWLIVGCVPLLVLAGLIEGFLSPAEGVPWPVKWAVGLSTGLALHSYLWLAGRDRRPQVRRS